MIKISIKYKGKTYASVKDAFADAVHDKLVEGIKKSSSHLNKKSTILAVALLLI